MLWEELSTLELKQLAKDCGGVCVLPIGCIEKHGNHLPTGTDMYIGRAIAEAAAKIEKVLVFPYYFFGQASECKHFVGCISASHELLMSALLEMCDEISRNGFKKIILLSSHGGNHWFLNFFAQKMPSLDKDYVVYVRSAWASSKETYEKIHAFAETTEVSDHAGLAETALIMHIRPDLVHIEKQDLDEGKNQNQIGHLTNSGIFTGLSWYGDYPNHYGGDHTKATKELGKFIHDLFCYEVCEAIRVIKSDIITPELFLEYNNYSREPK